MKLLGARSALSLPKQVYIKPRTMKQLIIPSIAVIAISLMAMDQIQPAAPEYKVITVVESIVPAGIGRSRIIETGTDMDVDAFTTERTDGKKSDQGSVKRKDAKVDVFSETKILNFYSAVGINFRNIASNDALIGSKINKMVSNGWELEHVISGVEADGGKSDGVGIYITRFIFKK